MAPPASENARSPPSAWTDPAAIRSAAPNRWPSMTCSESAARRRSGSAARSGTVSNAESTGARTVSGPAPSIVLSDSSAADSAESWGVAAIERGCGLVRPAGRTGAARPARRHRRRRRQRCGRGHLPRRRRSSARRCAARGVVAACVVVARAGDERDGQGQRRGADLVHPGPSVTSGCPTFVARWSPQSSLPSPVPPI